MLSPTHIIPITSPFLDKWATTLEAFFWWLLVLFISMDTSRNRACLFLVCRLLPCCFFEVCSSTFSYRLSVYNLWYCCYIAPIAFCYNYFLLLFFYRIERTSQSVFKEDIFVSVGISVNGYVSIFMRRTVFIQLGAKFAQLKKWSAERFFWRFIGGFLFSNNCRKDIPVLLRLREVKF